MSQEKQLPRFYYFANSTIIRVILPLCRVKLKVTGVEHVPLTGPLLIVSNHLSVTDPPFIGVAIPRDVEMMSKVENFEGNPLLAWVVRNYGAFPVRRGESDIGAIRYAMKVLKDRALYMTPEGTRSHTGEMHDPFPGATRLAVRTNAPVLPVGIYGQENIAKNLKKWRPTSVRISIGRPFRLISPSKKPDKATLTAISDAMMECIAAELPPAYRGRFKANRDSPYVENIL